MIEVYGDLWSFTDGTIAITTNGFVKHNGCAVMGRGCALEASQRYPRLPGLLGGMLKTYGNKPFYFPAWRLVTFPVKHNWWEKADLKLIEKSAKIIPSIASSPSDDEPIYIPRPGCGNGGLRWEDVKPILESIFTSDKYRIVTHKKEVPNSDNPNE